MISLEKTAVSTKAGSLNSTFTYQAEIKAYINQDMVRDNDLIHNSPKGTKEYSAIWLKSNWRKLSWPLTVQVVHKGQKELLVLQSEEILESRLFIPGLLFYIYFLSTRYTTGEQADENF